MSYCVNCGVELDPSAKTCPLCGTPAWHPELDAPPYFPANSAAVQPASRREAAILLTAMLVSVSLCCGLLNLFLPTDRPWSLYVIGAAGLLAMGIEFCIDRYFRGVWQPGWSLIVLAVCVGLIIPLRIVRRVPSLREEARRRFNL